jgi:inosine-uridine nucleoside N-ribohydrolase
MSDPTAARPRMIVDCDPGHDDAVMLVLASRHADVVGITTVSGNAPLAACTTNALAITELLGWDVPVHSGAARPLLAEPFHAPEVHGETGLAGTDLPPPRRELAGDDAVAFISEATRAEEGLWIVATGPLTNVALALRSDPGLAGRIAGICFMGGGAGDGNVTAAAEFNVWADPEAAAIVVEAGCPVWMCGLDCTRQFLADRELSDQVRRLANPVAGFLADIFDHELGRFGSYATSTPDPPMHDPVALLAVTHPDLVRRSKVPILVETGGVHARGATIVDRRLVTRDGEDPRTTARTEWCHTIDAVAARQVLVDTIATFGQA